MINRIFLVAAITLMQALAFAQTAQTQSGAVAFDYPELQVTPRASKRLEMEAKNEASRRWINHLPIQASSLLTLIAGVQVGSDKVSDPAKQDGADYAKLAGIGVGTGWLALTTYLAMNYTPYNSGWSEVSQLQAKGTREDLTRERLAEEALDRPAKLGSRLMWLSVGTNLATSAFMLSYAGEKAKYWAAASAVASLTPLLFQYHWNEVSCQHDEYKKKIYGPVTGLGLLPTGDRGLLAPGLFTSLQF